MNAKSFDQRTMHEAFPIVIDRVRPLQTLCLEALDRVCTHASTDP